MVSGLIPTIASKVIGSKRSLFDPPGGTNASLSYSYQASAGQMGVGTTAGNAGQLMSISGTIGALTESANYAYDNCGRLATASQTSNGSSTNRRFFYDRWGNRTTTYQYLTQIQSINLQTVSFPGTGSAPTNRITSVTTGSTANYSYDANGNVTNDGLHSYSYDSENRLVNVDNGAAVYAYDHQNRRYKKTIGSSVTHYVWEGSQVVGEYNGSTGTMLAQYGYAGSRMIAKSAGGVTQCFLSDRLSMRLALSNVGVVVGRQGHLPFGEDFGESGTQEKHHFTSYESDSESGVNYAINRNSSPTIGRFQQADPYKASGGLADAQSWDRYTYARNDPIKRVDPLGLQDFDSDLVWDYCGDGDAFPANLNLLQAAGTLADDALARQRQRFSRQLQEGATRFLQNHPDCQSAIDLAAQESGSLVSLSQLLDNPDAFVDTTGNQLLLGTTLRDLHFSPADYTPDDLNGTLGRFFTPFANGDRAAALANEVSGVIYFAPNFFSLYVGFTDRSIIHEALHVVLHGSHSDVANRLGLRNAQGGPFTDAQDQDARGAVNNWLEAGCPSPPS